MFLARGGKQGHRKENGKDALTNERNHSALAQLSVSRGARKAKARWWRATAGRGQSFDLRLRARAPARVRGRARRRVMIERRLHGVTITRGGPHRKTQRVERSIRSRSAFCRHATVFRADFLHTKGHTV